MSIYNPLGYDRLLFDLNVHKSGLGARSLATGISQEFLRIKFWRSELPAGIYNNNTTGKNFDLSTVIRLKYADNL